MRPDERVVPATSGGCRLERVENHVGEREPVDVPEDVERPVDGLDAVPVELHVVPGSVRPEDVEPQDIDAELVHHLFRRHHVAETLAHLAPLGVESEPVHQDALVGGAAERHGARPELGVEPAPGLVLPFGDEVRRPEAVEGLALPGEPEGRPRRDRRVEPDVEDVGDPAHLPAAGARDDDLVNVGAVRIGNLCARPLLEFGDGADDDPLGALLALPDGDGDAPVALPGYAPVA